MAGDARRLIEHLGFERADVMGYSMAPASARSWRLPRPSGCAA